MKGENEQHTQTLRGTDRKTGQRNPRERDGNFLSVRANKVMEIVPMWKRPKKGSSEGEKEGREGEPKTDSHNVVCQPACSRLFLPFLARYTFGRGEEEKRRDSEKLEMRRKKGEEEALALGWSGGGYLSLFAERTIHFRVAVLDPPSMRHDSFYFGPALTPHLTHDDSAAIRRREEDEKGRGECNPNGCRRKPTANVAAAAAIAVFFALMARS